VDEVADHTLAFILGLTRQVLPNACHLRNGQWGLATPLAAMQALRDLTVGVVGFGRIGREVVQRLLAFKAHVLVFDPVVSLEEITLAGALPVSSLDELLPRCEIITPHCPSTAKTRGLFNAASFARMKPGAIFINVSRGDLVDSPALVAALQRGHLSGAGLDVFDPEPIPADHPIRQMSNVILAAHIASASVPAARKLRETAATLALKAVRGEPLPNIVNGVPARS
jgi:D-3-phosphoglycerate dehydrogenase